MIRYAVSRTRLTALIQAENAGWHARADAATAANRNAGRLVESDSIWSDIKPVFMRLQHNKCVYCERPLAGETAGRVEQDVEHYRPKGRITAWPKANSGLAYDFATGAGAPQGYFWLAYDTQNYAASCKPCNSTRKSDAFPILGDRGDATMTAARLRTVEKPLLIFPFGDWGDDPEGLIRFEGIVAMPVAKTGAKRRRALVTIDFFGLNIREELWEDRFRTIRTLFDNFELRSTTTRAEIRDKADRAISEATSDAGPQARCARDYLALLQTDPALAWTIYLEAERFVNGRRNPTS